MHSPWPNSRQETGGSATDTQNKIRYKLDNKISCEQRRTGQEYNNITPAPYTSSHCAVPGSIINNDLFTFSLCRERVAVTSNSVRELYPGLGDTTGSSVVLWTILIFFFSFHLSSFERPLCHFSLRFELIIFFALVHYETYTFGCHKDRRFPWAGAR